MEQNLVQNVETLFTNMENFAQKEGLIGKAVIQGDKTFLPVLSVTLGYGGGDTQSRGQGVAPQNTASSAPNNMSGGALGLGAKLSTEAVIIIDKGNVSMAPINATGGNMSQMIDKIPQILTSMNSGNQQQKS